MGSQIGPGGQAILGMAGKGKKATPQASYGGQTMSQADAQAKYQADMAAWRAPTTTGSGYSGMDTGTEVAAAPQAVAGGEGLAPVHLGVPTTNWSGSATPWLGGGGPALPAMGVLPTAPVPIQPRQTLARYMSPSINSGGGTAGDRKSSSGYGGSASGGRSGFGGSSSRSGGLY